MEHGKFLVGCWALWEHRNKVVFDDAKLYPASVVRRVEDVLAEGCGEEVDGGSWSRGRVKERPNREVGRQGWKAAGAGFVKVNIDAGVKEGEGVVTGGVCRDERGEVLWGFSIGRDHDWEPHFAEAMAVLDGVQEAAQRGYQDVIFESDCLEVINALNAKGCGRSGFSLIIDDILLLCSNFHSVLWSHTSRENNCVAHAMAHLVPRMM
ncbi:uncharacterized protein LOC141639074, partial [Silene latifolia]|uniref:uncharacterized protein LOC141639074 n=1 Tax=Silene latifolia TaxID=37657 RepID=UPI003D781863